MKRIIFYCVLLFAAFSANASDYDHYENEVKPKLLQLKNILSMEKIDLKFSPNTAIQLKEEILKCIDENCEKNTCEDLISNLEKITQRIFQEGTAMQLIRMTIYKKIDSFMIKDKNETKIQDNILLNEEINPKKKNKLNKFNYIK